MSIEKRVKRLERKVKKIDDLSLDPTNEKCDLSIPSVSETSNSEADCVIIQCNHNSYNNDDFVKFLEFAGYDGDDDTSGDYLRLYLRVKRSLKYMKRVQPE